MMQLVLSKIISFKVKKRLEVQTELRTNIFRRLYLDACEIFPEHKLQDNCDIASTLAQEVLGLDSFNLSVDDGCIKTLRERASSDELILQSIADYHRITAYIYSTYGGSSWGADRIEESMDKAKRAIDSVGYLDKSGFRNLSESMRKDKKLLKKNICVANKLKVEREKSEMIKPIRVTASHFSIALTFIRPYSLLVGLYTPKVSSTGLGLM